MDLSAEPHVQVSWRLLWPAEMLAVRSASLNPDPRQASYTGTTANWAWGEPDRAATRTHGESEMPSPRALAAIVAPCCPVETPGFRVGRDEAFATSRRSTQPAEDLLRVTLSGRRPGGVPER